MTVCLHCGCSVETLRKQAELIADLESKVREAEAFKHAMEADAKRLCPRGFTQTEARFLSLLLTQEVVSNDMIARFIAGDHVMDAHNYTKVYACKLRKKLAPLGLEIECVWGIGYRIPRGQRELAREKLAA